jgi:hypothetical protein
MSDESKDNHNDRAPALDSDRLRLARRADALREPAPWKGDLSVLAFPDEPAEVTAPQGCDARAQ